MSNNRKTIGHLVPFGITLDSGDQYLIYMGTYGIEYLIDTVRECLNKLKETEPEYAEAKFKEFTDKLFKGSAEGEGCFRVIHANKLL